MVGRVCQRDTVVQTLSYSINRTCVRVRSRPISTAHTAIRSSHNTGWSLDAALTGDHNGQMVDALMLVAANASAVSDEAAAALDSCVAVTVL